MMFEFLNFMSGMLALWELSMGEILNLKRAVTCVVKNKSLTLVMHSLYRGITSLHFKKNTLINIFPQMEIHQWKHQKWASFLPQEID